MVGLDVACCYLSAGLIEACFVGGPNLTLIPEGLSRNPRILSRNGQFHTFDTLADSFTRADATSMVYLKRLDNVVRDGDPMLAIIRGSSNGFDGKTPGVLMPSKEAQIENIYQAYRNVGIRCNEFADTAYFECHGTGTQTGDPIELDAIGRLFAIHKSAEDPLLIGSAKTNLGHSEAASALTHIIKALFILETGLIPPTFGIKDSNLNLDFHHDRIKVSQDLMPLPKNARKRVSIQAFVYGGANFHTVLEAPQEHPLSSNLERCAHRYSSSHLITHQIRDSVPSGHIPGRSPTAEPARLEPGSGVVQTRKREPTV